MLSSGVVEGLNNKAKLTMRKAYGFRTFRTLELALYHSLGKLPEPESTHDFFLTNPFSESPTAPQLGFVNASPLLAGDLLKRHSRTISARE